MCHTLLVDDEPDVAEIMMEMLQTGGYRVSLAVSGAAMRATLGNGDRVDLVILDSRLPDEPGPTLACFVTQLRIPLIICSGSAEAIEQAERASLPALLKPFRMQDLADSVTTVVSAGTAERRMTGIDAGWASLIASRLC